MTVSQFPSHTSDTLERLDDSLARFHQNKSVFTDLGVRNHFNISKFHSLVHYRTSITLFGTADNYNTEQSERLHIDFAKDAYRATNRRDQYLQMTTWLERREKVQQHSLAVNRRQQASESDHWDMLRPRAHTSPIGPPHISTRTLKLSVKPSIRGVSFEELVDKYGAVGFQDAMATFIAQLNYPGATGNTLQAHADDTLLPFHSVSVFHKIKFSSFTSPNAKKPDIVDAVHVRAEQWDQSGCTIPARFDTVLVRGKNSDPKSMHGPNGKHDHIQMTPTRNVMKLIRLLGNRIAQVRVVFQISSRAAQDIFCSPDAPPTHLAYVQWFSPLSAVPDVNSGMYKITKLFKAGSRCVAVIPVELILCSVHLFPQSGPVTSTPQHWDTFSVLDDCHAFFINPFSDGHNYFLFAQ